MLKEITFLFYSFLLILFSSAPVADGNSSEDDAEYEFVPSAKKAVTLERYLWWYSGHLNANGDFVGIPGDIGGMGGGGPRAFPYHGPVYNFARPYPVYEYRSGLLIRGKFVYGVADGQNNFTPGQKVTSNFIPEPGSKVISFKDHKHVDTPLFELRTYHVLPGRMPALHAQFKDHTSKLLAKHGMTLIGCWNPEGTDAEKKLILLVAHKSWEAAYKSWDAFDADPDWKKARQQSEKDGKIVAKVEPMYMTDFHATTPREIYNLPGEFVKKKKGK